MSQLILLPSMVVAAVLPSVTYAEAPDIYVGGNYGYLSVDNDDFDDDDDAYTFNVGGHVTEYFGLELGYSDFGQQGNSLAEISTDGLSLAVLGYLPLANSVYLYGKAGVLFWDSELNTSLDDFDSDGQEGLVGVGLEFQVNDHFALRVDYTRYKVDLDGDEVTSLLDDQNFDLNNLSIGAQFEF